MLNALREFMGWVPLGLPAWLFVVTIVVFFHELGHFAVARMFGVRVETFSIGFGRALVSWTDKKGTLWKVSWIPFGGYVKFFGDVNAASAPDREAISMLTAAERSVAFPFKPLYQRALVVAAGPVANFILAIVIFTILFMSFDHAVVPPVVGSVVLGTPAQAAGIEPGDVIRSINGSPVTEFDQLPLSISMSGGQDLTITLVRGAKLLTVHATPRPMRLKIQLDEMETRLAIGVGSVAKPKLVIVHYDPLQAFVAANAQTWLIAKTTLRYVGQIVSGRADMSQLRGPVGTAGVAKKIAAFGILSLINLAAVMSVSIGLVNLFPIPLLDGGHLLYYGCEAVLGRPLGERAQDFGFRLGLAFVLGLMILLTWNDVARLNLF